WRQKAGEASESWGWYKKKIKRCDNNGNGTINAATETKVCLDGNDCGSGVSCITDENDYNCPISDYKTLGTGRVAVNQPAIDGDGNYWAGVCPASQSGCSEYIEPVSRFSVSLLFNGDFSQNVDLDGIADGWSAAVDGTQDIKLEANTLYVLAVEGGNSATVSSGSGGTSSAIPAGAVAYWKLDEGSGVTAYDSSGNGNTGNLINMENSDWVGGKVGGALEFDGTDDHVLIPDSPSLDIANNITLEAWFINQGVGAGFQSDLAGMIVAKHWTHNTRSYDLRIDHNTKKISFQLFEPDNSEHDLDSNSLIIDNQWYYVVATYDKATGMAKIYLNGQLDNSQNIGSFDIMQTAMPATIGCYLASADGSALRSFLNGIIDEVRIYNKALTQAEISNYYNSIVSPPPGANDFYELNSNNNLAGPYNSISVTSSAGSRASKRFYPRVSVSAQVTAQNSAPNNGSKIELKQAAVDYQLKQDLDDTACNGVVNFEEGCVLFNERAQNGTALAGAAWDADLTVDDGNGVVPNAGVAGERDSNILLKVSPDRVCDKWLACRSYIKDEKGNNVCFDIGLCNGVDENGSCNSFVITNQVNQTYNTLVQNIGNMSGYAKVGYNGSS
ncbi:MAG: LamG domain-containing protein, partial [Candidatus Methanoperedens sp.]|nr:LamG domain-containing protein [Candidatus Methanoperedens sp.]